jgi:xanthine dehydrogenase small subunit
MSRPIRFHYRGAVHAVDHVSPTQTVLQHLREDLHCTGTKEGCAEGDCGACTVIVGELRGDALQLKAVNSCIQFTPTLDGKALFTVEDLQGGNGELHPVQQAMVECHGSQCGFCTPGFVMSLWGLYLKREEQGSAGAPCRREIDDTLSGNLCRCTGYRPIIDAARRMTELPAAHFDRDAVKAALAGIADAEPLTYEYAGRRFDAPRALEQLARLRAEFPQAYLLAGSTDVGLWVTKGLRDLPHILYLGQVEELRAMRESGGFLEIGAGVSLEEAYNAICARYPQLSELRQRFASLPIRQAGTLGGNVANGSPIGDSMPWLIAAGARVVLRSQAGARELALEDFYLGYQKKDLRADEVVAALRLPLPRADTPLRSYKLAKRFDQDISAVCAAFALTLADGRVSEARIAYGGMAATPKRAAQAEAALRGQAWDEAALEAACAALERDYAPLTDMRASSRYRMTTAKNLLRRYWLETRPDAPLPAAALNAWTQAETQA